MQITCLINLVCRKVFFCVSSFREKMNFLFELTLVVINVQHKCKSVSRITWKHSMNIRKAVRKKAMFCFLMKKTYDLLSKKHI